MTRAETILQCDSSCPYLSISSEAGAQGNAVHFISPLLIQAKWPCTRHSGGGSHAQEAGCSKCPWGGGARCRPPARLIENAFFLLCPKFGTRCYFGLLTRLDFQIKETRSAGSVFETVYCLWATINLGLTGKVQEMLLG